MMMKIQKVIRDGNVAVLYSPGFGAGWSTWTEGKLAEFVTFDERLVEAAESGKDFTYVEQLLQTIFGEKLGYMYTGGWSDIKIMWLPVGTIFEINEYDGSESIRKYDISQFYVA
jgi:hypothetical protein